MKEAIIYIHGKGGNADEARHYQTHFPGCDIIGFDYKAQTPWEAEEEFPRFFDSVAKSSRHSSISIIANSIGAYFAMCALGDKAIKRAFLISPIVDMEKLITDMMRWANVTEDELRALGEIKTDFGETLSWKYLRYAKEHPILWSIPTHILYGGKDNLTSPSAVSSFALRIGAKLTVMENGEHWFHTEEQMEFLDKWIEKIKFD